jgi:hypothetical protein
VSSVQQAPPRPPPVIIITQAVSNAETARRFPGYKTIKPYLRVTNQPGRA